MMEAIMEFVIELKFDEISEMENKNQKVKILPFTGYVDSKIFKGKILPGAADIQITNPAGIRHMCAKYMFAGTDENHQPCHLFVENNGYFQRNQNPSPFEAHPTFITDSPALQKHLDKLTLRSEGYPNKKGVIIKILTGDKE